MPLPREVPANKRPKSGAQAKQGSKAQVTKPELAQLAEDDAEDDSTEGRTMDNSPPLTLHNEVSVMQNLAPQMVPSELEVVPGIYRANKTAVPATKFQHDAVPLVGPLMSRTGANPSLCLRSLSTHPKPLMRMIPSPRGGSP